MPDFVDYRPSDAVLQALRNVSLVTVVGPSGAGKTTLIKLAVEQDPSLHVVVSDVSRAPRPGEQDGVDYFFRDRQEMLAAIARQEYVQAQLSNSGDIYASHVGSYATEGTAIVPVWADAVTIFRALPFKRLRTIFIVPDSYEAWQARLGLHEFPPELQAKRLAEAERSLTFGLDDPQAEIIVNGDLAKAAADFLAAIHRPSHMTLPDQTAARQIVRTILARLHTEGDKAAIPPRQPT